MLMSAVNRSLPWRLNRIWEASIWTWNCRFLVKYKTERRLEWRSGTCRTSWNSMRRPGLLLREGMKRMEPFPTEYTTLSFARRIGVLQGVYEQNQWLWGVIWRVAPVSQFQSVPASEIRGEQGSEKSGVLAFPANSTFSVSEDVSSALCAFSFPFFLLSAATSLLNHFLQ